MKQDDTPRTDADAVMSNLEFFASAPLAIARRALALAQRIVGSRGEPGKTGAEQSGHEAEAAPPTPAADGDTDQASAERAEPAAAATAPKHRGRNIVRTTHEIVHAIRRAYNGTPASAAAIAEAYGLSADHVTKVATRARWKNVPAEPGEWNQEAAAPEAPPSAERQPGTKLDRETVEAIRSEYKHTPTGELAKRYATSPQTIRDIGQGRTHKEAATKTAAPKPRQPEPARRTAGRAKAQTRRPKKAAGAPNVDGAAVNGARAGAAILDRHATRETDLSEIQVREIRREAKQERPTEEAITKLADEFDVPTATIEAVIEREAWSHLQPRDDETRWAGPCGTAAPR